MCIFEMFKKGLLPTKWQKCVEAFASNGQKKKEYWFRVGWYCQEHKEEIRADIAKGQEYE